MANLKDRKHEVLGTLVVTASHNPSEYNGLKMTYRGGAVSEDEITKIKNITKEELANPTKDALRKGICRKIRYCF